LYGLLESRISFDVGMDDVPIVLEFEIISSIEKKNGHIYVEKVEGICEGT